MPPCVPIFRMMKGRKKKCKNKLCREERALLATYRSSSSGSFLSGDIQNDILRVMGGKKHIRRTDRFPHESRRVSTWAMKKQTIEKNN